jgi:hypothetical protein
MNAYRTIQYWVDFGYRTQFLSPKAHLKQLVNYTNIDQYVEQAEEFAKKCSRKMFKFNPSLEECLDQSINMNFILAFLWLRAVRELQSGTENSEYQWRQVSWLGGQYVKLDLATTRYRQYRADQNGQSAIVATAEFHFHAAILKNFLRIGDIGAALDASICINDMIAINGYYDFNDPDVPCSTGALITTLVLEHNGQTVSDAVKQRFKDDELVAWFYENWDIDDLLLLRKHLELMCDRHTQMSREYSNRATYEFPSIYYYYDISEVLSVLRLRQIANKAQPELSHKLLNTPMGVLMDKAPIEKIDVYETVINKCIDEFNQAITNN